VSRIIPVLVACAACRVEPTAAPFHDPLVETVQAASERMHQRFSVARAMEDAIARGELRTAQLEANIIDTLDEPAALHEWQPFLIRVRDAAHAVAIANGLDAAAREAGRMGEACARCHQAIGAHVRFIDSPILAARDESMSDHHAAGVAMWEGLIGPADDRWLAGAKRLALIEGADTSHGLPRGVDDALDDATRIRGFAREAPAATSPANRGVLFGRLLATCAHCHSILRDSWIERR
jgi:hypothetical protein